VFKIPEGIEEVKHDDKPSLYKALPESHMDIVVEFLDEAGKMIETREIFDRQCYHTLSPEVDWRWSEVERVTTYRGIRYTETNENTLNPPKRRLKKGEIIRDYRVIHPSYLERHNNESDTTNLAVKGLPFPGAPTEEEIRQAKAEADARWEAEQLELEREIQMWKKEGEIYEAEVEKQRQERLKVEAEQEEDRVWDVQDKLMK